MTISHLINTYRNFGRNSIKQTFSKSGTSVSSPKHVGFHFSMKPILEPRKRRKLKLLRHRLKIRLAPKPSVKVKLQSMYFFITLININTDNLESTQENTKHTDSDLVNLQTCKTVILY